MEEMYNMGIVTHNYGVISVLGVIIINIFILLRAKSVKSYKRSMLLFNPIGQTAIGVVIFTGVIMMAAKHLEFDAPNVAMIIFAIAIIYLEVKRSLKLKYLSEKKDDALATHKTFALKIFVLEVFVTISISLWMWI